MSRITAEEKYSYIIGTKINKWTALRFDHSRKKTDVICQCECGTIKPVNLQNLINNKSKDCGCGRKKKLSEVRLNNLEGQRFGKLTVLELLPERNNLKRCMYRCLCDCGNETIVAAVSLRTGHTQSCGCLVSKGNMKIGQILSNLNIEFRREYQINFNDTYYKFDFYLPQYNLMIEYDGEQHFAPARYHGANEEKNLEDFKKVQERDKIKNQYCEENHINLLRIPYTEQENMEEIIENHLQRLNDKGTK